MERYVAIDNVCAWPSLTLLPNGEIVATIFNKPYHGLWAGDVECWVSADGGRLWTRRGVPAPHEPGTNRMNVAAGLAANHDLLVLASGWSNRGETPPKERTAFKWGADFAGAEVLVPWVCRSRDHGLTWERSATVDCGPGGAAAGVANPVPFGDISVAAPGLLVASVYLAGKATQKCGLPPGCYSICSRDDGRTWGQVSRIGEAHNETAILCLTESHWLAAARSGRLDLFVTEDAGAHWRLDGPLTGPAEYPAHLLRLRDGRVLLTHGVRLRGYYGVGARLSDDRGKTWCAPARLLDFGDAWDGGYPSTVELADGTLVTAYYASRIPAHRRYHMGVILWRPEEAFARNQRQPDEF